MAEDTTAERGGPAVATAVGGHDLLPLLAAFSFTASLGGGMLNPLLPDVARSLDVSVALAGQLATASMVVGAAAALAMGTLSDVYGRRPFLVSGFAVMGAAALGLALAPSFGWALLARLLAGFGFVMAVNLALVGDLYEGIRRDRVAARLLAAEALAWIAGVPVLAVVGQLAGWRPAVAIFGVLGLALAVVGLAVLPRRPRPAERSAPGGLLLDIWRQHRHRPDLAIALAASALRNTSWIGLLTYASAFFMATFGVETWQMGPLLALGAISFIAGTELGGRLSALLGLPALAAIACLIAGSLGALLPLAPTLALSLLAMVGYCVGGGMANAALIALVLRLAPASRGATMAVNSTLSSLGAALGTAAGGLGIAVLGYPGLGLVVALFAFLSAILILCASWMRVRL